MRRNLLALALLSALSVPALAAEPPAKDAPPPEVTFKPTDTIVKVNGEAIPAIYAEFVRQGRAAKNMPPEMLTLDSLKDALVATELMVQDAHKKGLDKSPTLTAAMEFQRREMLAKAALEDFLRNNPIGEDVIKAEYDKAKSKAGDKEYSASHILVATENEAKDLIAKLKNRKTKFEDLAKKHSKDSSSAEGGKLPWNIPANVVPEFAQAMTALKKGETSKAPVQTQFGWHVIRVDDVRDLTFPSYDEIKGRIAAQLQQLAVRRYVQSLRAEAKVE